MSDSLRAQKLAAARKKLKEFQQKAKHTKKENVEDDAAAKGIQHDEEQNMTASTHSSLSRQSVEEERVEETANVGKQEFGGEQDIEEEQAEQQQALAEENNSENDSKYPGTYEAKSTNSSELPIYNYFSNEGFDSGYNQRSHFFDVIADNQFQTNGKENTDDNNELFNTAVYLDNNLYSNHSTFKTENLDEMYDNVHKSSVTYNDAKEISHYLDKRDSASSAKLEAKESDNYYEQKDEKEDNQMLDEISHLQLNESATTGQQSNLESLKQLSSQMAQLADCKSETDPSETAVLQLERRNQELASLLEQERVKSQQLAAQLNLKDEQIHHLESTKAEQDTKVKCELSQLQEQLQNHIQTIGILVGEKTELSAMLSQAQTSSKQKTMELEELQEKLKNSNHKITALEGELNSHKSEKTRYGEVAAEQSEAFYKLRVEYENLKLNRDELSQDLAEVHEKLSASSGENIRLQKQLQEVNSQLSLANIRIQQLTMGDTAQLDAQMESVMQQKLILDKKVTELSNTLETVTKERDQANAQYQQYVLQLNNQLSNLADKLETVTKENETLVTREQNLVRHIGELEKHLQNVQSNPSVALTQKSDTGLVKELQDALQAIETLKLEKEQLRENFTRNCNERDMLIKDLESKKDCIYNLESHIENLRVAQPDTTKLLAELESAKVAAARAISQNNELKKKLQDIEDDFVKMSNDKLELTEQLTRERNLNKELTHKLQHCESQLQTLADAIAIKDRELTEIRENSNDLNKEVLQLHQLADRARHYEAQNNSVQAIQDELADAKQEIVLLANENVALKEVLQHKNENKNEEGPQKENKPETVELEPEHEVEKACEHSVDALDKESAMKHLEQKFLKTMQDIANLTEEKQRLEHLVLQLQSETETIGEYIALYQHQRGILKQRAIENDEQRKQLAEDREVIKKKLEQLNSLVKQLVLEKGSLPVEILEHHERMDKVQHEFCEEHAKIHEELGKMTNESKAIGVNGVTDENRGDGNQGRETAEKIIEILSEIKTSSLVQPAEKFHPCPLCSGNLITV